MLGSELALVCLQGGDCIPQSIRVQRPEIAVKGTAIRHASPGLLSICERPKPVTNKSFQVEAKNIFMSHAPLSEPAAPPLASEVHVAEVPLRGREQTRDKCSNIRRLHHLPSCPVRRRPPRHHFRTIAPLVSIRCRQSPVQAACHRAKGEPRCPPPNSSHLPL